MRHDPERAAAAYLAGELSPGQRERLEAHMLGCEDCWREVRLARLGRSLAESAREVAPAHLRESVRASIALTGTSSASRPPRVLVAAAAAVVVALGAASFAVFGRGPGDPAQPQPIAAALAAFRSDASPTGDAPAHQAPDLASAGLSFEAGAHEMMGGLPVDAFSYRSGHGSHVLLLMSGEAFPVAGGAADRSGVRGWEAEADGVIMMCASRPMSYLLLGDDRAVLGRAELALGTQPLPTA